MRAELSVVVIIFALAGCYNEAAESRSLVEHQTVASGFVVSVDCGNHGAIYYKFVLNGLSREGRAAQGVLPNCTEVPIGYPVRVFYDATNPELHTVIEPSRLYEREHGYYIPYLWLAPLALLGLVLLLRRRGRAPRERQSL